MDNRGIVCWEVRDPNDDALGEARRLYEATLDPAERIPWQWIAGAVAGRLRWRPGERCAHLILAADRSRRGTAGRPLGFVYGTHLPGYGGYACYLGVDARQRGRGAATRLLRLLISAMRFDADCAGESLPFVVWESHHPGPDASEQERALWQARLRLFERVGGRWISGLTFLAPDFRRRPGPPVPLQLFLIPVDTPAEAFDADALRGVAAGLYRRVYGIGEGDELFEGSLPPTCRPVLRPIAEADGQRPAS